MSDEYTIDAKLKATNHVWEHEQYRQALISIAYEAWEDPDTARAIAREALDA